MSCDRHRNAAGERWQHKALQAGRNMRYRHIEVPPRAWLFLSCFNAFNRDSHPTKALTFSASAIEIFCKLE
jgi:hypothetical protein